MWATVGELMYFDFGKCGSIISVVGEAREWTYECHDIGMSSHTTIAGQRPCPLLLAVAPVAGQRLRAILQLT